MTESLRSEERARPARARELTLLQQKAARRISYKSNFRSLAQTHSNKQKLGRLAI